MRDKVAVTPSLKGIWIVDKGLKKFFLEQEQPVGTSLGGHGFHHVIHPVSGNQKLICHDGRLCLVQPVQGTHKDAQLQSKSFESLLAVELVLLLFFGYGFFFLFPGPLNKVGNGRADKGRNAQKYRQGVCVECESRHDRRWMLFVYF